MTATYDELLDETLATVRGEIIERVLTAQREFTRGLVNEEGEPREEMCYGAAVVIAAARLQVSGNREPTVEELQGLITEELNAILGEERAARWRASGGLVSR